MNSKTVVRISLIAALYAVFTVAITPLSYSVIQVRLSEMLKVFVLYNPVYAIGIGIGTFMANLASPYISAWELVWMPLTDCIGGFVVFYITHLLTNYVKRTTAIYIGGVIYAMSTALAVGLMLDGLGVAPIYIGSVTVFAGEIISICGGTPIMINVIKTLQKRGIEIADVSFSEEK